MAEKFSRGTLIVLILLAIMAGVELYESFKTEKQMLDIIRVVDSRTEHLLTEVNDLKAKVSMLQRQAR